MYSVADKKDGPGPVMVPKMCTAGQRVSLTITGPGPSFKVVHGGPDGWFEVAASVPSDYQWYQG